MSHACALIKYLTLQLSSTWTCGKTECILCIWHHPKNGEPKRTLLAPHAFFILKRGMIVVKTCSKICHVYWKDVYIKSDFQDFRCISPWPTWSRIFPKYPNWVLKTICFKLVMSANSMLGFHISWLKLTVFNEFPFVICYRNEKILTRD